MKKSIFITALLLLSSMSYGYTNQTKVCDGSNANPCVVQDTKTDSNKIKHWRNAQMIQEAYQGNTIGLKNLWVSVSGSPNNKTIHAIAKEIDHVTKSKYKKMIFLDLREESHAYLNGEGITLTTTDNWINKGKSHQQTVADEETWVHELGKKGLVPGVLTNKQFNKAEFTEGKAVEIKTVELEREAVEKEGFQYMRLTVSDHMRPVDAEVDSFVSLVRHTPDKVWVHMHCRGGNGRSTTFFAMMDMLKNADKVSFNDIIKRQASVKPFYNLADTDHHEGDMAKYYVERYQFLKHFYQFASDSLAGFQGNWSDWLKVNSK